jgi:hypothetical protein
MEGQIPACLKLLSERTAKTFSQHFGFHSRPILLAALLDGLQKRAILRGQSTSRTRARCYYSLKGIRYSNLLLERGLMVIARHESPSCSFRLKVARMSSRSIYLRILQNTNIRSHPSPPFTYFPAFLDPSLGQETHPHSSIQP